MSGDQGGKKKLAIRIMMKSYGKWFLIFVLPTLLLAPPVWGKKAVVVISRSAAPYNTAIKGFRGSMRWEVKIVNMLGDMEKGRQIMKGLVTDDIKVVVVVGSEAILAAKSLTAEIPLIYTMIMDSFKSSKRPISGVILKIKIAAQLSRIKKIFPTRRCIGVIYNPLHSSQDIEQAREVVKENNLKLFPIAVEKADEIPAALLKMTNNKVDILWIVVDKTVAHPQALKHIIAHSHKENIPLISFSKYHVKAGALAAFAVDFFDIGAQTAELAQKVYQQDFKQRSEKPRKIIIYVNPKIQKQMGIDDLSVFPEVHFIQ